ncbi:arylsulfatase B-like [Branchiostoma floridae]|uniref:Arylsulfatase B-like n=1 Tax=Branchiostoma floridae TaxID=7739 RepID=A0A9J7M4Y0_BRAFL|nr:arylsulfatase B-like [Branchiostoma floridae]
MSFFELRNKWHLGFCNWNFTPTYRGFDSFYGYYNGAEDYYTHVVANGLDLRDNKDVVKTKSGQYGTYFFTDRVVDIVEKHPADTPLFMYLPYQNVHQPLQVPKRFEDMYASVQDENRRKLLGMVSALDEAVDNVTMAMKKAGLWDDTLVIFTTDNGGWISASGNNYPLRGGKVTLWEGGTRGVAFAHGKMLQKTGYTNNEMIHAVDWFPTILAAAGGTADEAIDGVSQLDTIMSGQSSPRTEFVYNIDDEFPTKQGAIRVGDYKLIEGYAGKPDGWILPPNLAGSQPDSGDPVIGTWLFNLKGETHSLSAGQLGPRHRDVALQPESQLDSGDPVIGTWLFNLKDDPTEHHNLADSMPDKLQLTLVPLYPGVAYICVFSDDPTEHHNLADSMPDKLREMQAKLHLTLVHLYPWDDPTEHHNLADSMSDKLHLTLVPLYSGVTYFRVFFSDDSTEHHNLADSMPDKLKEMQAKLHLTLVQLYPRGNLYPLSMSFPDDPTEHHNLADSMPDKLKEMRAKLEQYRKSLVPAIFPAPDPKSNPDNWGGAWSPGWC